MVREEKKKRKSIEVESAETTLPGGCMLCGGDLELKVTGRTAVSYCKACRWVGRPDVSVTFNGLQVGFKAGGEA